MPILTALLLSAAPMLEVTITGLHSDRGDVRIAIFSSADGWPQDDARAVRRAILHIDHGKAVLRVEGLAPGRYAAAAFHDEDGDGKLTKGAFGIPKEGWGASNGARGTFGPSFADATFEVKADTRITFAIGY